MVKISTKKPVDERRTEILDVTCEVVVERGFGATRVVDVSHRINVSTGLIHYHFDTKDALLSAAFHHAAQRDLERLEREVTSEPDAVCKLVRIVTMDTPEQAEAAWMMWIDAWGEALRNPILRNISQDLDIAWKSLLEAVIVEGVEAGTFRCADPHGASWRLTALLDGLAVQVMAHDKAVSRDEMQRWILHAAALELGVDEAVFAASAGQAPRLRLV